MVETMNMMELPIDRIIEEIKIDFQDDNYDPVMIIGKSGIGKTMSIYELTQQLGIGFCEMRLVTMTEVDLLGLPTIDEHGGTTYAANSLLPRVERDGERGILVLDEITSAKSTVRAAAYQLLDSKRALGNYKLPEHWKCVGMGNGMNDGGVYSGMDNAFLSRATCFRAEPDLDSWKKWATKNGVNPVVIAFLNMRPEYIHKFDPDAEAELFPCPRSWTALSKKLNSREARNNGRPLDEESVQICTAGAVGMNVASMFSEFYQFKNKTLDISKILDGSDNTDVRRVDSEVMYITIESLVSVMKKELDKVNNDLGIVEPTKSRVINLLKWVGKIGMQREDYGITLIQDLCKASDTFKDLIRYDEHGIVDSCKEYTEFEEHAMIVLS